MSKIDLLEREWIDLVFEGKNEAYGAYAIRRDTSHRNLMAVIALICSAGLGFIILSLWNEETLPASPLENLDPIGIIMLIATFIAVRLKVSVIKLLAGSGVCGLILGMLGKFF